MYEPWAFFSDCTENDFVDHFYLCVCFYFIHCKMQVKVQNALLLATPLSKALQKFSWTQNQKTTGET